VEGCKLIIKYGEREKYKSRGSDLNYYYDFIEAR
jgi:hypothetical protein